MSKYGCRNDEGYGGKERRERGLPGHGSLDRMVIDKVVQGLTCISTKRWNVELR